MINRKSAIAVLIAVFLIGCLLGASGTWLWEERVRGNVVINDRYIQHDYSVRIFDRLQITPEQKTELKKILDDSRREINACRNELQNKMDEIRANTNDRIAAILDKDQKVMFEQLIREADSRGGGSHHGRGRSTTAH